MTGFWICFGLFIVLLLVYGIIADNKRNTGKYRFYKKDFKNLLKLIILMLVLATIGIAIRFGLYLFEESTGL